MLVTMMQVISLLLGVLLVSCVQICIKTWLKHNARHVGCWVHFSKKHLLDLIETMDYLIYGYICRREDHKTKRPVYNFILVQSSILKLPNIT